MIRWMARWNTNFIAFYSMFYRAFIDPSSHSSSHSSAMFFGWFLGLPQTIPNRPFFSKRPTDLDSILGDLSTGQRYTMITCKASVRGTFFSSLVCGRASLAVMVVFFRFWNGYVHFEDVYHHMFIMADFFCHNDHHMMINIFMGSFWICLSSHVFCLGMLV